MDSSREYKYSVLRLIESVKVRPELWDSTRTEFRSYKNKDKIWQEVFEELDDNYRFLSEKEQTAIAMKITTKWRNIRDVFIRSVKKRSTDRKMKKYMYHDKLSFMLKLYKSYLRPESPIQFEEEYSCLESFNEQRTERCISFDNIPEGISDGNPKASIIDDESLSLKTEPDDGDNEELTNDDIGACSSSKNIVMDFDDVDDYERTSCLENQKRRLENDRNKQTKDKTLFTMNSNQRSNNSLENVAILRANEDEAFMTSIMPSLSDMSLDEKLQFRIAVLQKIHEIRSARHNY